MRQTVSAHMIEAIRPSQLHAWLATHASLRPMVLDVREPWECDTASIRAPDIEVRYIPMGQLMEQLVTLDANRPVACLCHHGARSMQVALFLQQQGFACVANITGGIHAWSQECDQAVPTY